MTILYSIQHDNIYLTNYIIEITRSSFRNLNLLTNSLSREINFSYNEDIDVVTIFSVTGD